MNSGSKKGLGKVMTVSKSLQTFNNIKTTNQSLQSKNYVPTFDNERLETFKTKGQLKKSLDILTQNVFTACKKNNYQYIEKNRERVGLAVLCAKNNHQNTPIYLAVANKHMDTTRYLLDRGKIIDYHFVGVPINIRNEKGNTVLHKAFMNQDYDMIGYLQSKGADFTIANDLGQTPLYFGSKKLLEKLGIVYKPTNYVRTNKSEVPAPQTQKARPTVSSKLVMF